MYTNLNFSIKKLFGCSSIFNSLFFIYILYYNKNLFIILIFIYLISFSILTYFLESYEIDNINFRNFSLYSFYLFIILLFIYSSFPLFLTFIFKWEFIYYLNSNFRNNLIVLLILIRVIILWNYFILIKYIILKFKFKKIILNIEISYIKNFILFILSFFSFIFILFNLI